MNDPKTEPSPIYSKDTIIGFSMVFGTLFGGILLRQNLIENNNKKDGNTVLIFSILYTLLSIYLFSRVLLLKSAIFLIAPINALGMGILIGLFFNRNFPYDPDQKVKKIWKPMIISFLVTFLITVLITVLAKINL